MTEIFSDIQNGTLPQGSIVTPPFPASDHGGTLTNPRWPRRGLTSITTNTLTLNKKLYANTAIFASRGTIRAAGTIT